MISQEALCLPRDGFAISQDSMEDYWSEVRNITESGPICQELLLEEHSMDGMPAPGGAMPVPSALSLRGVVGSHLRVM